MPDPFFNVDAGTDIPDTWNAPNVIPVGANLAQAAMDILEQQQALNAAMNGTPTEISATSSLSAFLNSAQVYKPAKVKSAPYPKLTYPVIPEKDEAGKAILTKTRYALLEDKYARLYAEMGKKREETAWLSSIAEKASLENSKLKGELSLLRASSVDSEIVMKRMDQVCKELGLPISTEKNMAVRLNHFFGQIWTKLRSDAMETEDEVAE